MIIVNDRTEIDTALNDPETTVLILAGERQSSARNVHDFLETQDGWEAWWRWFLILDVAILDSEEKRLWFDDGSGELYAVVGGRELPKLTAKKGQIGDLLKQDGSPGKIKIRSAY